MRKRRKGTKELRQADQDFSAFLKGVREESGVSDEVLGEGLVEASLLSRIENGQRPAGKMLRNRLLGRLGVATDLHENLLDKEDYAIWEMQQEILYAIEQKAFQKVQKLIGAFERQDSAGDKIKSQFCHVIKAELLKQQGADCAKLGSCYETAVRITVPEVEQIYVREKALSVVEINMVLEYEFYKKENGTMAEEFAAKCQYLMGYVEKSLYDTLSKAKIYPKIAFYYLRDLLSGGGEVTITSRKKALQVCDRAIEMLRDTQWAFYLVELLECKREILTQIINCPAGNGNEREIEEYMAALRESVEMEELLKKLYAEYGIPEYMQDCTYLYRQRWVFSIGDVLRIRRNMYGMTQQEVCAGICSVKSLRRAEKKLVNMQREALGQVMRRLGLSKEIQKTDLVTNDRKALELNLELMRCRNNRETGRAREVLNQLKEALCLEIPENRQYVMEAEASLDLMEGKITGEAFAAREKAALQCTLDLQRLRDVGELYLTEMEMVCIRKSIQWLDETEKRKQIDFMLHFFEKFEQENLLADYIAIYEFVIMLIASELGNMGEYQLATGLSRKALKEVLKCRRLGAANEFVYDMLWNAKEQKARDGQQLSKEKMTDGLRACLALSHFCRQVFDESFYSDKLNQLMCSS
ncbi:MAG: helix-turn-helix domain-containing protein [Lachnospiraceae bacterium]|nr:helix-turn-helix domain-containing protein [Lachnospiraceae bacterium]